MQSALHFSVCQSRGLAIYACIRGRAIGVDVEALRPIPGALDMAGDYITPREYTWLRARPGARAPGREWA